MSKEEKPGNDRVKIKFKDDALGFLRRGLHEANQQFVEGNDAGRRGVMEALGSVVQFLSFFEGTTDHRQPLTALLNALLSLDEGDVLPLLKPLAQTGRRPASAARESDKGIVAAMASRLRETGIDINEAYEMVARVCREAGIKPSRKGAKDSQGQEPEITGRTVRGWCEKINEDVGRHSPAAQTFDRLRQSWATNAQAITQAIESKGIEAVRNDLLESLRRTLIEMRAPEH